MATNPQSSAHQNSSSLDTVISDEIMEELYAFREAYAAQFGYDIDKMFEDLGAFANAHPVGRPASIKPVERKIPAEDPAV